MKGDPDLSRLGPAMARSRLAMRDQRESRMDMVEQTAGNRWGPEWRSKRRRPLNMLSVFQNVVVRNLVSKNPHYMFTTPKSEFTAEVRAEQDFANHDIKRMRGVDTFQRIAADSLYLMGIAHIALATPCEAATTAWRQRAGSVMLSRVDFEDFCIPNRCHDFSEMDFIAHRYRCPLDVAKDLYHKHADQLSPMSSSSLDVNKEGDWRIGRLSRGSYGALEFEEHVELWQCYLPRHNLVVTISDYDVMTSTDNFSGGGPLWVQEWIGPDSGPYHVLGLGVVPGSPWPKAPMMDLMELDDSINNALRKIDRMIRRVKELTFFPKGEDTLAEEIMRAIDGSTIGVDDPKSVLSVTLGGTVVQPLMQIVEAYRQLFNIVGGNIELLAGLGPQSRTATQDTMLEQNASAGVTDYQERTVKFIEECGQAIAWYHHHDPVTVQEVYYDVPGLPGQKIPMKIYPWNHPDPSQLRRTASWEEMDVRIDPYSIRLRTPQERMKLMDDTLMQVITPMLPILQQDGYEPDVTEYLKIKGELSDFSDISRIMKIQEPSPANADNGAKEMPHDKTLPVSTTREVVRRSQSGETQKSNQQMQAALLGVDRGGNPSRNGQMNPMGVG